MLEVIVNHCSGGLTHILLRLKLKSPVGKRMLTIARRAFSQNSLSIPGVLLHLILLHIIHCTQLKRMLGECTESCREHSNIDGELKCRSARIWVC